MCVSIEVDVALFEQGCLICEHVHACGFFMCMCGVFMCMWFFLCACVFFYVRVVFFMSMCVFLIFICCSSYLVGSGKHLFAQPHLSYYNHNPIIIRFVMAFT